MRELALSTLEAAFVDPFLLAGLIFDIEQTDHFEVALDSPMDEDETYFDDRIDDELASIVIMRVDREELTGMEETVGALVAWISEQRPGGRG